MIKIEMWPHGDESKKRDLAAIAIANVGGDSEFGDYGYSISHQIDSKYGAKWEGHAPFANRGVGAWKTGQICGFMRAKGAVKLLAAILRKSGL